MSSIISQIVAYLNKATTRSEAGTWLYAEDLSAVMQGDNVDRGPYSHGVSGFYFVCTRTLAPLPSNYKDMPIDAQRSAVRASAIPSDFFRDCADVFNGMMGYDGLSDTPYGFPITAEDLVNGQAGHGGTVVSLMTTLSKTVISVEEFAETINARAIMRGEAPPITIPGHSGDSFTDHSDVPPWTLRGHEYAFDWNELP